ARARAVAAALSRHARRGQAAAEGDDRADARALARVHEQARAAQPGSVELAVDRDGRQRGRARRSRTTALAQPQGRRGYARAHARGPAAAGAPPRTQPQAADCLEPELDAE